jgi:hypothetical protein
VSVTQSLSHSTSAGWQSRAYNPTHLTMLDRRDFLKTTVVASVAAAEHK